MEERLLVKPSKKAVIQIVGSIVTALSLVFALLAIKNEIDGNVGLIKLFFLLAFISLSSSLVIMIFRPDNRNKIAKYRLITVSSICVILGILFCALNYEITEHSTLCGIYLLSISANRACRCFEKKKIGYIIFNSFLSFIALILGLVIFGMKDPTYIISVDIVVLIIIMAKAFINILIFAFVNLKLGPLLIIIRKTYAFEVLYGLLVLIFSFSFIFQFTEESMVTYGDALWYSFAVVTTIGFGDLKATTVATRVLSVILGLYGIIATASITSVIVNFYNEIKHNDKDKPEEDNKEIEEKNEEKDQK